MEREQEYETTVHLVRGYMGFVLLLVTLLDVKHKRILDFARKQRRIRTI